MVNTTLKWREVRKVRTPTYREWRDTGKDYVITFRSEYKGPRARMFMALRLIGEKKLSLNPSRPPERFFTFEAAAAACERHASPVDAAGAVG